MESKSHNAESATPALAVSVGLMIVGVAVAIFATAAMETNLMPIGVVLGLIGFVVTLVVVLDVRIGGEADAVSTVPSAIDSADGAKCPRCAESLAGRSAAFCPRCGLKVE